MISLTGALIAYFALGANLLGTALLLLFNPHSRAVRWFVPFELALMAWLATQGWALGTGTLDETQLARFLPVHFMPGLFLAFALAEGSTHAVRAPSIHSLLAPPALALVLLLFVIGPVEGPWSNLVAVGWQVAGWGFASVYMMRHRDPAPAARSDRLLRHLVLGFLTIAIPAMIIAGIVLEGDRFFFYVMPLLTVVVQLFLFVGVMRWRYYDIEVRAARSGELASRAGEIERLALVGELAASVAHEVRNPLTGIRSLAQRLTEETLDDERRRRYADVIVREVERVEKIVADLLDLARKRPSQEPTRGPTPLDPLFADLALLVGGRAERARATVEVQADGAVAAAPREPLAQVLLNLLLNALEHSPAGGLVELTAREDGSILELLVRDQGPGVPDADRERVFEPMVSGHGGTGLGLAVVRRLAKENGWRVTVEDAPAGGAEFRVRVPRAAVARASERVA